MILTLLHVRPVELSAPFGVVARALPVYSFLYLYCMPDFVKMVVGADDASGKGPAADAIDDLDGGDEGEAQKEAAADWEESEGDGEGAEAESGAKFAKPRSRRKMWQLEDDMHLLIVYAQAGMCLCVPMCVQTGYVFLFSDVCAGW